jgi:hypothetical protein
MQQYVLLSVVFPPAYEPVPGVVTSKLALAGDVPTSADRDVRFIGQNLQLNAFTGQLSSWCRPLSDIELAILDVSDSLLHTASPNGRYSNLKGMSALLGAMDGEHTPSALDDHPERQSGNGGLQVSGLDNEVE